jgi:hypothetical protein
MKKFKPLKFVCRQCIITYGGGKWTEQDEKQWASGLVRCPQMMLMRFPSRPYCIKADEVDIINSGYVLIWDHTRL